MFRAVKIACYLKAMHQRGIAAESLLSRTGVDLGRVSDPGYLIELEQFHHVIANMMKLTKDPGLAFSLGDAMNLSELGILGYAMISSSSLRQALSGWIEYANSILGAPINVEHFNDLSPGYELIISSPSKIGAFFRFQTEEFLVQGMKMVKDITGIKPILGKVSLAYPEPPHRSRYDEFCRCPVEFDAPKTIFRVLHPDLDASVQTRNQEMFAICAEHCREVMRSAPNSNRLREQLREIFLASPGTLPNIKEASVSLGISPITMHRQLAASGKSYQAIKDQFRFDLSREYILSGHMSSKQVAYFLGFASPSAFARAFKTWSGKTVGQFIAEVSE